MDVNDAKTAADSAYAYRSWAYIATLTQLQEAEETGDMTRCTLAVLKGHQAYDVLVELVARDKLLVQEVLDAVLYDTPPPAK